MVQSDWAYQSAQIAKTAIVGEQSTDIEIQTADGDKVTLSSNIEFESVAITYEELGRTNSGYSKSQGQIISANANSNLELTVEGSLDEQEKKEIKEVLMSLFKMVKDFITGKADSEENHNFANLTTISEVKAEVDINASITSAAQSASNYVAQTTVEEQPVFQKPEKANLPIISERVDKLTDRMIEVAKDSEIEPSRLLKRLNRRLSKFSRKSMNERPAHWQRMQLRQAILEDFVKKLQNLAAENEAEIKNTDQDDENKAANISEPAILETTSSVSETVLNVASQEFHFGIEYSAEDDG
jgi:hypothetical protein